MRVGGKSRASRKKIAPEFSHSPRAIVADLRASSRTLISMSDAIRRQSAELEFCADVIESLLGVETEVRGRRPRTEAQNRPCSLCVSASPKESRPYCFLCERLLASFKRITAMRGVAKVSAAETQWVIGRLSRHLAQEVQESDRWYLCFLWPAEYFDLSRLEDIQLLFSPENVTPAENRTILETHRKARKYRTENNERQFRAWAQRQSHFTPEANPEQLSRPESKDNE